MVWKTEYELGNELIDSQHKELFTRVETLNNIAVAADAGSRKQECIDAILFLKDYAVNHFAAEEAFQKTLGYKFIEFHKAIHRSFVTNVLELEKVLIETNFDLPVIKQFCGFLSMWLIYHVAGADRKIISNDVMTVAEFAITVSYEDCVLESLKNVLVTLSGGSLEITKSMKNVKISNPVQIDAGYDETMNMRFVMSASTALYLINSITGLAMTEVDELASAALEQLAKTISDSVAEHMSGRSEGRENIEVNSDSLVEGGEFIMNTDFGHISVSLVKK